MYVLDCCRQRFDWGVIKTEGIANGQQVDSQILEQKATLLLLPTVLGKHSGWRLLQVRILVTADISLSGLTLKFESRVPNTVEQLGCDETLHRSARAPAWFTSSSAQSFGITPHVLQKSYANHWLSNVVCSSPCGLHNLLIECKALASAVLLTNTELEAVAIPSVEWFCPVLCFHRHLH